MYRDNLFNELIVDNFAGGGGASVGMELAIGRPVDIAVNHDADAIAMHKVNHPYTTHYQEDVFVIDPEQVTDGRRVGVAWFSPDCKHFSKAKGGKPVDKKVRGLSWVILKWAMSSVAPRVIFMENVEEIQTWGPCIETESGLKPDPTRAGETFKGFVAMLTDGIDKTHPAFAEACEFLKIAPESEQAKKLAAGLGYSIDWKTLKACDYGAPTIRKRFYLIARRDGQPIIFPKPTHGKGLKPYKTASDCIDWTIPCLSIFGRKKPLAVNTLRRIARGTDKWILKNPSPYIMEMNYQNTPQDPDKPTPTQTGECHEHLMAANLVHYYGGADHASKVDDPLATVTVEPHHYITESHLCILRKNTDCKPMTEPTPTITAHADFAQIVTRIEKLDASSQDFMRWAEIREFLNKYAGYSLKDDEIIILEINNIPYFLSDIGMRMLKAEELKLAQGFPPDYVIDIEQHIGKKYSEAKQIARLGNAVCPPVATALVRANCAEICTKKPLKTVAELEKAIATA